MAENKNTPANGNAAPSYDKKQVLSIIKASNEMLDDVVDGLIERGASDTVIDAVRQSVNENLIYAKNVLGATEEDVKKATYHGANISEIKAYEDRLKRRGLTDESVRRKDSAVVAEKSEEKKPKRRVKGVGLNNPDGTIVSDTEYNEKEGNAEQKRRARRKRETGKSEPVHTKEYIEQPADEPAVVDQSDSVTTGTGEQNRNASVKTDATPKDKTMAKIIEKEQKNYNVEQFDMSDVPDYVQYDIIPLPSNGQCYAHKKGRIPVAYLTASDENLIASPNMYRDGKLLDVILRRKVLDKSINVDDLCTGDRDAIILWLRATAYGDEFPISVSDRETGKRFDTVVKLSSLKYDELTLEGDENGCLTFTMDNNDVIKFRYLSKREEIELRDKIASESVDFYKFHALSSLNDLIRSVENLYLEDDEKSMLDEDFEEIRGIIDGDKTEIEDIEFPSIITEYMIAHTTSVNGNSDERYIRQYIENMRSGMAKKYREFINNNKPGVNFNITVNRPESDGGGSFDTFLRLDDSIFFVS